MKKEHAENMFFFPLIFFYMDITGHFQSDFLIKIVLIY